MCVYGSKNTKYIGNTLYHHSYEKIRSHLKKIN